MAVPDGTEDEARTRADVSALRSTPERTVFTEDGNADGWISTDVAVPVER